MTITPTIEITAVARITPADVLAISNDTYRLGIVGRSFEVPATANQVYTRNITLNAAATLDLTLQTMMLETTDSGVGQKNADGVALALTKLFALIFIVEEASASVVDVTIDSAAAASPWTGFTDLKIPLKGIGAIAALISVDAAGYAVDNTDQIAFTAGAGTGTITGKLIAIGYQA